MHAREVLIVKSNQNKALARRSSSLTRLVYSLFPFLFRKSEDFKLNLTSKLFWGRSSFYKNITHTMIIGITLVITFGGLFYRVSTTNASPNDIAIGGSIISLNDIVHQGGSVETVIGSSDFGVALKTVTYIVQPGDTLESIAQAHNVTMDTIRWASKSLSPFSNRVDVGMELTIPEINGVLYTVKQGDTLDSIISIASLSNDEANRFNIVQFNNLEEPITLTPGQKLFIPDGNLKDLSAGALAEIPRGVFSNPLQNVQCAGYRYSRGVTFYHNGVDLTHPSGCPISAVANGTVFYAGWSSGGEGYNVKIDHGGGIITHYYHGNGELWVKSGERVQQGQALMKMGTTGNSTGIHLHFSLFKDGRAVNPYGYVPY